MHQASSTLCTVFGNERQIFQAGLDYVTSGGADSATLGGPGHPAAVVAEIVDRLAGPAEAS